jgi:nucleoside-diphosphate-sugar epimerase
LSFVQADLSSDSNWTEAVKDCRYVLHIASPISTHNPADENEMIRPTVDGALRVLKASSNAGVKRVVLLSSYGAVGYTNKGTGIVTESDWTNPEDKHLPAYPKSKTLAERAAWEFMKGEGTGLELSVVNPVAILGPSLSAHVSSSFDLLRMLLDGNLRAVPKIVVNVGDVRDVTDLLIRAMLTPEANGQRIIASTERKISLPEIAALLKKERPDVSQTVSSRIAPSLVVRIVGLFNARARVAASMLGMNRNVSIAKATRLWAGHLPCLRSGRSSPRCRAWSSAGLSNSQTCNDAVGGSTCWSAKGLAREALIYWCDTNHVDYVFGLPRIYAWKRPSRRSFRRRSASVVPSAGPHGCSVISATAHTHSIAGAASAVSSAKLSTPCKAPIPGSSPSRRAALTPARSTKTSIAPAARPKDASANSSSCLPLPGPG